MVAKAILCNVSLARVQRHQNGRETVVARAHGPCIPKCENGIKFKNRSSERLRVLRKVDSIRPKSASEVPSQPQVVSGERDSEALIRYVSATLLQFGVFTAFLALVQKFVIPFVAKTFTKFNDPATTFVGLMFLALSFRSRIFSPLDNSRPSSGSKARDVIDSRKRPSWTPPWQVFPFVWTTIGVLRGISTALVFQTTRTLMTPAIIALALHLSIGDTWNNINNVEAQTGTAVPGVYCVWLSALATLILYYQVNPTAAYVLLPMNCWLTVASTLITRIWQLNGSDPWYPSVKRTPA